MTAPARMHPTELARPYVEALAACRPVLAALFEGEGLSLGTFLAAFTATAPPALQDRSDYGAALAAALRKSQGEEVAKRAALRIERSPVVYTANHLCLESMALTVQSMVLAGLAEGSEGPLPVEACGLVPADNASYPVGLLVDGRALRLPLLDLTKRQRRRMAMALEGFRAVDLDRARLQVEDLFQEGRLEAGERAALHRVLEDLLGAPEVLARSRFMDQAEVANPRLWEAWFTPAARAAMPPLAYVTSEALRLPLLLADLANPGALVHRILLDPALRKEVLLRLEGVPCCWVDGGRQGGTTFFWAVDEEGRTSPLWAEAEALRGEGGADYPLRAEALQEALAEGRLVPSIFLNLTLGLARGLVQIGGFNQVDYLGRMQRGLAQALAAIGDGAAASRLSTPLPPMFTAGLAAFAHRRGAGEIVSAGGIALIARDGLDLKDLERARRLALREAMLLELPGLARLALGEAAFRGLRQPDPARWNALIEECLPQT